VPALTALCAAHEVTGVLTQPDRPRGRGRALAASPVKRAALERGLTLAQPASLRDPQALATLSAWAPEVLVVVAYGLILPAAVLALPPEGCLNIHASLLPRWRGAAPIQRAILAGDRESGVTIMRMDAGLDTGPMLLRQRHALRPGETAATLEEALAALGARLILEALDGLGRGTLTPEPQPAEGVTYARKIEKAEALLDFSRDAAALERQVRAFNPRPVAETRLHGEQLRIWAARVASPDDLASIRALSGVENSRNGTILAVHADFMLVKCGAGLLAVTEVQVPGRKPIPAADFARSRQLPGQSLG